MDVVDVAELVHVPHRVPGCLTQENEKGGTTIREFEREKLMLLTSAPLRGHQTIAA